VPEGPSHTITGSALAFEVIFLLNDMTQDDLDNFAEDILNGSKLSDDDLRELVSIN